MEEAADEEGGEGDGRGPGSDDLYSEDEEDFAEDDGGEEEGVGGAEQRRRRGPRVRGTVETRARRTVDEHFDRIFAEYEDDEIGGLDDVEFDETVGGDLGDEASRVVGELDKYV